MNIRSVFFAILIFLISATLFASSPRIELQNSAVIINGQTVINFRTANMGQTPQDRANLLFFQLMEIPDEILYKGKITILPKTELNPFCIIKIGSFPIVTVTEADASALSSTVEGLAQVWVKNIKEALTKMPLYITEKEGIIPIGETRIKNIYGYDTNNITYSIDNPDICSVTYDPFTKSFSITGTELGQATLSVSNGTDIIDYSIFIRKYAADFPERINLTVTGSPTPSALIKETLDKAINRQIITEPGAKYRVNSLKWSKKNLFPNQSLDATANVTAYGDEYITVTKNITFTVNNYSLPKGVPNTILYSNNPETVEYFQELYTGEIKKGECNRLLYHHMNKTGKNGVLIIEVINTNDEAVNLRVRKAAAKPILDTIAIGVVAAKSFINMNEDNVSITESIPANSRACFLADNLKNTYSSSGIIQFWQLSGDKNCIIRVRMVSPDNANIALNQVMPYLGKGDFTLSDFVFNDPHIEYNETYQTGGKFVFMHIGKNPLENDKHLKLYGNYGVDYTCNITLTNPTDKAAKARIYLDPGAGSLAAYIKINNEYLTIHHVKPPNEADLAVYSLQPGETKKVTIKTMPVSGSNYPAKIIVGTVKTP